ncbi:MAG: amidohydrolase [Nitrospinota bacterium]|nr:amidohydrolase [Nitrospinota bacterium]
MSQTGFGGIDTHMHLFAPQGKGPNFNVADDKKPARPGWPKSILKEGASQRVISRSPGAPSQKNYLLAADNLLAQMDLRNVAKAIVMPPPQHYGQIGAYEYDDILPAIQNSGGRLLLAAGGGELNPMITGVKPEEVTSEIRQNFEEKARRIIAAKAVAFGEMAALHLCMNPRHHYMAAPPDHPLFFLLADLAAESGLPIDLHMEAVPVKMATPTRLLRQCGENPSQLAANIPGLERLLAHNPKAKIVWQHIGWDNTGHMTPALLGRLLKDHSNLFLSIRVLDPHQTQLEGKDDTSISDQFRRIKPEWAKLIADYPDRIMVGGDEFIGPPALDPWMPPSFEETWRAIDHLLEPTRSKLAWQNAARVYNIQR